VLEASKKVGLEGNTERTEYVVMSCHQNAKKNLSLLNGNKSFKDVTFMKKLSID